jgi:hypothetical protein
METVPCHMDSDALINVHVHGVSTSNVVPNEFLYKSLVLLLNETGS